MHAFQRPRHDFRARPRGLHRTSRATSPYVVVLDDVIKLEGNPIAIPTSGKLPGLGNT